jgi:hypothetical protein
MANGSTHLAGSAHGLPEPDSSASVRRLFGRQILAATLLAMTCGVAIVYVLGRVLSTLLFGIRQLDPLVLTVVATSPVLTTLVASAGPLRRGFTRPPLG